MDIKILSGAGERKGREKKMKNESVGTRLKGKGDSLQEAGKDAREERKK
jgi:hypothetical protein